MFCRNCGEVILDTDITCPNCGFAAGTGTKYCPHCATPTDPGATVCELCGQPVNTMPGAQPFQTQAQGQYASQPQFAQQPQFVDLTKNSAAFQQQPQFSRQPQGAPTQGAFSNAQFGGTQQFRQDPNQATFGQSGATYIPNDTYGQTNGAYNQNYYQNVTYKSKVTAGVLGIILGAFGIHNFYLGYTAKGVVQLLMTICSCGVLGVISAIWGFVEGVMILTGSINTDAKGLPLKD